MWESENVMVKLTVWQSSTNLPQCGLYTQGRHCTVLYCCTFKVNQARTTFRSGGTSNGDTAPGMGSVQGLINIFEDKHQNKRQGCPITESDETNIL